MALAWKGAGCAVALLVSSLAGGAQAQLDCSDAPVTTSCSVTMTAAFPPVGSVETYGCPVGPPLDRGEVVWQVSLSEPKELSVVAAYFIPTPAKFIGVFVLGTCDEANCLAASVSNEVAEVRVCLTPGDYYVVLDGSSSTDIFQASFSCVDCAPTAVDGFSWGRVKSLYR